MSASRPGVYSGLVTFEFLRLRFRFQAVESLSFSSACAANTLRGGLGYKLRNVACRCQGSRHSKNCEYALLFEPVQTSGGPSGLSDWPRPFVLRARHLDGKSFSSGQPFSFDLHLFHSSRRARALLSEAFSTAFEPRARLLAAEQLDAEGHVLGLVWNGRSVDSFLKPVTVNLGEAGGQSNSLCVRFLTPTELKSHGRLAARPEFSTLFSRIRDRVSQLRTLYGAGPLEIDFATMGERAQKIEMTRCDVWTERATRHSSRTGQVHPLGGFIGEAEYQGDLAEFKPYLKAAHWTGVGRQTVWGKGEIAVG